MTHSSESNVPPSPNRVGAAAEGLVVGQEVWEAVYPEIKRLAEKALHKELAPISVQATDIAHQAYLNLAKLHPHAFQSRAHLLAIVAKVIRQLLVDRARARKAAKRGGGASQEPLEYWLATLGVESPQIDEVTEALAELETLYPRPAKIVELRFFGGLTLSEAAETLNVSLRTAAGDWALAKAWLRKRLEEQT